jgi:hypothetical protein
MKLLLNIRISKNYRFYKEIPISEYKLKNCGYKAYKEFLLKEDEWTTENTHKKIRVIAQLIMIAMEIEVLEHDLIDA